MRIWIRCSPVVTASLLASCATVMPPAPPVPRAAPTEVAASFGKTWDAVIDELTSRNIPIKTVDRSSGLIATDPLTVASDIGDVADCGSDILAIKLVPTDATYNV